MLSENSTCLDDKYQMILNHEYEFWKITSLFSRSLFIKYYNKSKKNKIDKEFIGLDGDIEGVDGQPDDQVDLNNYDNDGG